MSKNIVVFSDGTGQEGGRRHNTNVYKLFNMVEDRTPRQITFYDRGVGTGFAALTGLAGGRGFGRNVRDGYEFIFRNFQADDHIFLFGFSRGAATVRSLAYFIHLFGILPQSRPELIETAWRIYQLSREAERVERARAFIQRNHTMWAKVHFVGCYDTVAALGLPFRAGSVFLDGLPGLRHRFHNFELSPSVVHARHALAIDDERRTFLPLLWKLPQSPGGAFKTMRQVWFAGMHTDVGGGYPQQSLSDIPLVWMTQEAVACGLLIFPGHKVPIVEDADGVMHDSRGSGWTRLYRRATRSWGRPGERPVVHESVKLRTRGRDNTASGYRPWILQHEHEVEPWIPYLEQSWARRATPTSGASG